MSTGLASADLVRLFAEEMRLCGVQPGECVVIFTDPGFPHPQYPPAAFSAIRALGADAYVLTASSEDSFTSQVCRQAWLSADLVLGMSTIPRGIGSWMYTATSDEALATGARILMVQEPVHALRRMAPDRVVVARTRAGAELMERAVEMRVTSSAGSDFTLRKDGRPAHAQWGVADRPGRWDHWPSGLVACAPLEDSANGRYVIAPGDVMLGQWKYASSEVALTLRDGRIAAIDGGSDATLLREHLSAIGDDGAFRLSHAGWGTDHRADWRHIGMDSESLLGSVMVSLGRNVFNAPARFCGFAGQNRSQAHYDICCRNASVWLDGELVVNEGRLLVPPEPVSA
jgi:2,5-dihydroxypyridine 5,6-dioxygenase